MLRSRAHPLTRQRRALWTALLLLFALNAALGWLLFFNAFSLRGLAWRAGSPALVSSVSSARAGLGQGRRAQGLELLWGIGNTLATIYAARLAARARQRPSRTVLRSAPANVVPFDRARPTETPTRERAA